MARNSLNRDFNVPTSNLSEVQTSFFFLEYDSQENHIEILISSIELLGSYSDKIKKVGGGIKGA